MGQLVALDGGIHNGSLEVSANRIMQGGSWKKQRVIMILPAGLQMPTKAALAMRGLIFSPNQGVFPMAAIGMEVGEAYSNAISEILGHPDLSQWEYILTIEHDNIPPGDGVLKLIETLENHPEYAAVSGLYWTKGEGGVPQIWGDPTDPLINFRPQVPVADKLMECCGIGMGFALWRLSLFKDVKLRRPWFKTVAGADGVGTQDLYAWSDLRKHGYRCAVDCRVRVGHYSIEEDKVW